MKTCNFIPPTQGYAPCKREAGHDGPCAHEFAHEVVESKWLTPKNAKIAMLVLSAGAITLSYFWPNIARSIMLF